MLEKEKLDKMKDSDMISISAGELAELLSYVNYHNQKAIEKEEYDNYIKSLTSEDEGKKIEYPNQIGSIVRSKKTLGIDMFLSPARTEDGQSPLELHAGFSRFVFTIIDASSGTKQFIHANIHPDEVDLIKQKTNLAIEKIFAIENGLSETSSEELSKAYTVMMTSRDIAKKTPAQLLIEDPANRSKLENAKKWLETNISRYPKNQEQIDAIDDALDLFDLGQLKTDVKPASKVIDLYREDTKIPNAKKLNPKYNNKTLVYSISIVCEPGKDYPFAINIMNCYATPKHTPTGGIVAEMSTAEGKNNFSILLTTKEWNKLITKMDRITKMFEEKNFNMLYDVMKSKSYFK